MALRFFNWLYEWICRLTQWVNPSLASFWYLYRQLWTYFTTCSSVSIVYFEHVIAGWDNCSKLILKTHTKDCRRRFVDLKLMSLSLLWRNILLSIVFFFFFFKILLKSSNKVHFKKHNFHYASSQMPFRDIFKWSYFQELLLTKTYSEPSQTSKITLLPKIFNGFQLLTIFTKTSTLDVRVGFECVSDKDAHSHIKPFPSWSLMTGKRT